MANQEMQENGLKTKKHDFIEIEFTGRANNEIFDTTIESEAKKLNPKANPKPLVLCIGENMVVSGFDKCLEDKEIGRKYIIKLKPEEAFGKRDPRLVKLIPKRVFSEQNLEPIAGMTVALDNFIAKIISVSGGRIMVDLNNPVAGKDIEYEFTIKRKLGDRDVKERVNALQQFFFHNEFPFDLDDQRKKIIFKDIQLTSVLNLFKDKFKELTGYDVEIFVKPKKTENSEDKEEKTREIKA